MVRINAFVLFIKVSSQNLVDRIILEWKVFYSQVSMLMTKTIFQCSILLLTARSLSNEELEHYKII